MRYSRILLALLCVLTPLAAQQDADGPVSEKAQKAYKEAFGYLQRRMMGAALDDFKKADKQNGGHCPGCQKNMIKYGMELHDWKVAETAAQEMLAEAEGERNVAIAHYELGIVFMSEGLDKNKDEFFAQTHDEMSKALATIPNFPDAIFADGWALAHLKRDEEAKAQFEKFVKMKPEDDPDRQRALRYMSQPDLARARMAPPFAITATSGQQISLDNLKGKVVLIDFWATWCAPCREALPHMKKIVEKFKDEPLLVLSVSLDDNEQKWQDFVAKNQMTWPQYRDGGFTGPMASLFGVRAIPNTFTIDANGVLQEEHIGDASIEGKLKKLVAQARELQVAEKPAP
jgi:thiol-disulfide isomerase/thioredoxin